MSERKLFPEWSDEELVKRLAYWMEKAVRSGTKTTRGMYDDLWWACCQRDLRDAWFAARNKALEDRKTNAERNREACRRK